MEMKRIAAALMSAALLLSLAACGSGKEEEEEEIRGTAVEVSTVAKTDLSSENTVNGMIMAKSTVPVVPLLSGKVAAVNVAEGDYVTKGDVLMQVDTSTVTGSYGALQDSYANSKKAIDAGIAAAQTQLELAKTNYENTQALFEIGAASQLEVDSARTTYNAAQLQIEQARAQGNASLASISAQMSQIGTQASLGTVTAPVSGKVVSVSVTEGGIAGQSAAMIIAEDDEYRVTTSVSETLLSGLSVGDRAEVIIASVSTDIYETEISSIGGMINQQTGLYDIELLLPAGVSCPIGTFATVTFYTNRRDNVVAVPTEAIINNGEARFVYTLDGTTAHKIEIKTGLVSADLTEVTSGLTGGETLVTRGQTYLTEGALVRIVGEK